MKERLRAPAAPVGRGGASGSKNKAPVITWKGHKMVRAQSFLSVVNAIARWSNTIDVTRIGLIGDMHAGKTSCAEALSHALHLRMSNEYKTAFAVRVFNKAQLLDFESTLQSLAPGNYIMTFDDASFMTNAANRKKIDAIKEQVTTIRHQGARDSKMIWLINYHYSLGLDKYLRQADFKFYFTIGSSDRDNIEKALHNKRKMAAVDAFIRYRATAIDTGQWMVPLGRGRKHIYYYREPWIPLLVHGPTGDIRPIISPTRSFLDPHCAVCTAGAEAGRTESEIDPAKFQAQGHKSFGIGNYRSALKLILLENGLPTYSRGVLTAKRAIESACLAKEVRLESLLEAAGLSITKPKIKTAFGAFLKAVHAKDMPEGADPGSEAPEPPTDAEKAAAHAKAALAAEKAAKAAKRPGPSPVGPVEVAAAAAA